MPKLMIGSTAALYWGINRSNPKDTDYFYYRENEVVPSDSHKIPRELYEKIPSYNGWITPEALLTLKCSHLQWDIHWEKTKLDIIYWMELGYKIIPDLYQDFVSYWKEIHGDKSFLSLNKDKEEFFQDNVYYPIDHDELHRLVALPDDPVYLRCLKDNKEVEISKEKFDNLIYNDKVRMFKEEISVIALERYLLNPFNDVNDILQSYQLALKKTITNLTKNWASDFIIFNLLDFIKIDIKIFINMVKIMNKEKTEVQKELEELIKKVVYGVSYDTDDFTVELGTGDFWKISIDDIPEFDSYKHILQEGGGEGGTEYCFGIFKWKDHYFKVEWSYYSYEGYMTDGAFNTLREVFPKQVQVTVYD